MLLGLTVLASATVLYTVADTSGSDVTSGLVQWGIGGAILLAFVWPSMKRAERREDLRDQREQEEARARAALQEKLVASLESSVRQQGEALMQWREFERKEEKTHEAIVATLNEMTTTLRVLAQQPTR